MYNVAQGWFIAVWISSREDHIIHDWIRAVNNKFYSNNGMTQESQNRRFIYNMSATNVE